MRVTRRDVTGRRVQLRELDLDAFFHPKTVALIGASDSERRPNTAMTRKLRQWADKHGATVYPVNPNRDDLDGLKCYPSISDIPVDIDLAAILIGDPMSVLGEVLDKGARFAVIFAAGFAEVGSEGEALQVELEDRIAAGDTRLLGPNTNLNAFELFDEDNPGRAVALITQSGHQGRPIFQAQELGLNLRHWAPTGNEADLEFADFAGYFAELDDVGVIAAYIEGFKDGRSMLLAADGAAKAGKPLVVVKVGRTEAGREMARSHTGHLTGSDAVISAAFRQYGVTRVEGLDELQDAASMFSLSAPPTTEGVCVYAISGGTGAHMADVAASAGLSLPRLTDETVAKLRAVIPGYLRVDNPVDSGAAPSSDPVKGPQIIEAILSDPNVGALIVPITGVYASLGTQFAQDLADAAERSDKPVCVVWGSPLGDEEAYTRILRKSQAVVFRTFRNCAHTVRAWLDHHAFAKRYVSPFDRPILDVSPARDASRIHLAARPAVSEHTAKQILREYGIATPREYLVESAEEAVRAVSALGGRVVVKAASPDLQHKSELGLVALDLRGEDDVRSAATRMLEQLPIVASDAQVEGLLVAEMIDGGTETVIGLTHDDLFGPVVMFGLGGVFVEVLEDVTFRIPPFDASEARRMIGEVKGFPLLTGARGREPADLHAIVDTILKVQRLAFDLHDDIAELDINPFIARPAGGVAVDALIIPRTTRS
ncbi:MAG: acetate--CoA ligase family protein [Actinobacteria bacterium]|nr:acetate--CoA ligase family protein [Actinomycetota bacterium]